jgi:hypothetical protein
VSSETVGLQAGGLRKEVLAPGEKATGRTVSLESEVSVCSSQAARTRGIALVRRL